MYVHVAKEYLTLHAVSLTVMHILITGYYKLVGFSRILHTQLAK